MRAASASPPASPVTGVARAAVALGCALCLLAALGSTAEPVGAAPGKKDPVVSPDGRLTIHFESVELPVFVKFISKATGRNFVFSDKISGTVTVVSPNPVTADEAFAVFQSVLAVRGLTTIDDGIVTRVVPLKEARAAGGSVIGDTPGSAGFATRLVPLQHVDVGEVAGVLESLISKEGSLVPYPATNTLIASDTISNLDRISAVVKELDIPRHSQSVEIISLEHADAGTLAEQIVEIMAPANGPRSPGAKDKRAQPQGDFNIVADPRTNSLVVTASGHEMTKIRDLITGLDTPLAAGDERLHLYYARHADAQALVEVVSGMISGRRRVQAKAEGKPAAGTPSGFNEEISITADPATNAVIIAASATDYRVIEGLLQGLDIQRPQVFVETIIAEVSVDYTEALGIEWQAGGDIGNGNILGRSNLSVLNAALNPTSLGGLLIAAASDRTIRLPDGTEVPAQAALLNALAADSEVNILSAPTLLTLDNQPAEILVGENVPFVTGQGVDIASVENVFTTIEREDVGVKLSVTPQVSEGNVVILEIEEEVSSLVDNALLDANAVGPTTSIRSAKTTVSVADGHTAVLGGLISTAKAKRESKVPLLGDIPWLGRLFRSDSSRDEKVNLILFLTPHVIRNDSDLARISAERRRVFEEAIENPVEGDDDGSDDDADDINDRLPRWPDDDGGF